jgi:hypothetical protein
MKPKPSKYLTTLFLAAAFSLSSVGLPIVIMACPSMVSSPVQSSCCEEPTSQSSANLLQLNSHTCCSKALVAAPLKLESAEVKSTGIFSQKERAGLGIPSVVALPGTRSQDPSLLVSLIAAFSSPESSYHVTLPLRI